MFIQLFEVKVTIKLTIVICLQLNCKNDNNNLGFLLNQLVNKFYKVFLKQKKTL